MVAVAAGRRSGTSRRLPSPTIQNQQQQRVLALTIATRVVAATDSSSAPAGPHGGGISCWVFLECLLCILKALGMGSCLTVETGRGGPHSSAASYTWSGKKLRRSASGKVQQQQRRTGLKGEAKQTEDQQQQLKSVPGRIVANGACAVASLYTLQGKKGVNQDSMIVWENFGSRTDTVFCGVFDGHGPFGHLVSKRVRDILPVKLGANLGTDHAREKSSSNPGIITTEETSTEQMDDETTPLRSDKNGETTEILTVFKTSFVNAFRGMDRDLKLHRNIDCFFSGTTAVTVIKQGQDIIIGNLGDSRAVLGTRDESNRITAVQLTVDLKPSLPCEAARIRERRGRIFALPEEPEVARVWLPNYNSPGLAMARAFGDFCLKDYGLISVPDVFHHRITEKDEFVVLATDGVWDVLSNNEVVNIVALVRSRESAARKLVESAHKAWRGRFPSSKIDDCACVCLFLNADGPNEASNSKNMDATASSGASEADNSNQVPLGSSPIELPGTIQHTGVSANVGSGLSTDGDERSALEGLSRPITLPNLSRSISGVKLSQNFKKGA